MKMQKYKYIKISHFLIQANFYFFYLILFPLAKRFYTTLSMKLTTEMCFWYNNNDLKLGLA